MSRSVAEIIVLSLVLGTIILGATVGNLLVLLGLRRQSFREKPSHLLLVNLAISDLLIAVIIQPYQLATVIHSSLIEEGGTLCSVGGVLNYPFFFVSLITLVGMCVDRFYAFGNPLLHRTRFTFNVALSIVVYSWIHSAAFGIGTGLAINIEYDPSSMDCGLGWTKRHIAFTLFVLLTHIALPFFILLVSSVWLFRRLKAHNEQLRQLQQRHEGYESDRREHHATQGVERKLTFMVTWILTVFLICWTPYLATRSIAVANIKVPSFVQTGSVWFLHANSMINPIFYTYFRRDLKTAIFSMLTRRRNRLVIVAPIHGNSRKITSNSDLNTISMTQGVQSLACY